MTDYINVRQAALMLMERHIVKGDHTDPLAVQKAENTVRRYLRSGEIPAEKPTRRTRGSIPDSQWKIDKSTLRTWIFIYNHSLPNLRKAFVRMYGQFEKIKAENEKLKSKLAELEHSTVSQQ